MAMAREYGGMDTRAQAGAVPARRPLGIELVDCLQQLEKEAAGLRSLADSVASAVVGNVPRATEKDPGDGGLNEGALLNEALSLVRRIRGDVESAAGDLSRVAAEVAR